MSGAEKVLVVEDEALVGLSVAEQREELSYELLGIAATASTRDFPALTLIDINLRGEKDGIGVAEELSSAFGTQIIFMSGVGDLPAAVRSSSTVPIGFLSKPWTTAEAVEAVGLSNIKPKKPGDPRGSG